MDKKDFDACRKWFASYTRAFYTPDKEDCRNISLKIKHTYRVCGNIKLICKDMGLSADQSILAAIIALFHDIGRFPQYAEYRTFRDGISVNHGKLGADLILEKGPLDFLPEREKDLLITSVNFHNAFAIPPLEDSEKVLFLKLIRDADKLDIWRLFADYYLGSSDTRASAANLDLPDTPEYSEKVLESVLGKKVVMLSGLKTLNDFKLLQLSWVFDLNFRISCRLLLERKLIDRIAVSLPDRNDIAGAVKAVKEYAVFMAERHDKP